MSAAKMVILTVDQCMHATIAVMNQLRADRGDKRTPGDEYDKFLSSQIATGTETLNALNATTVTATAVMASDAARGTLDDLGGARLETVRRELHAMLAIVAGGYVFPGMPASPSERRARTESLNDALLFLESPK